MNNFEIGYLKPELFILIETMLMDSNGFVRPLPADFLREIHHQDLRAWCNRRARYGLPTRELVEWLIVEIGGRPAIEIGAGMGDLGRLLGNVKMTDSYGQADDPEKRALIRAMGQPPTEPPPEVEKLEAVQAVQKYRPEVVIGSWVSQCPRSGEDPNVIRSTPDGVDEERIWKMPCVKKYIHIGNDNIHGDKRLLHKPHEKLYFPWLFSRQKEPEKNVIYKWSK